MSSEIEAYQNAVTKYKAVVAKCEAIANTVHQASNALRNWRKTMMSNVGGGWPMEIALNRNSPSINGSEWVTAHQLATALQDYHAARSAMDNAYSAIPATQRDVVVPPPA